MPSDLQVSNIKDLTNANSAISIASDGQVTIEQNNPTVTLHATGDSSSTNTTFPKGHVIQTQYQRTYSLTTDSTPDSTSIDASHLEKSITITAGNSVFYQFNFNSRLYAPGSAYASVKFYVYHKEGSGSYSNAEVGPSGNNYRTNIYYDETTLASQFYRDDMVHISGIHTPSSGTVHSYKMYYSFANGNTLYIGVDPNTVNQYVILQEIQA